MQLNIDPTWLLDMVENEGDGIISVGGLVARVEVSADTPAAPETVPSDWTQRFPVSVMRKMRFSLPKDVSDTTALLVFFGVNSPQAWRTKWDSYAVAFRQTQKFDARKEAVAAWVRECEIVAGQIPLATFDERMVRSSLSDLRRLTRERVHVGLDRAQAICSQAGMAVVCVPELPNTRISGCARWLNERHALVGLTIRYKHDDQLWFTFFHEVGHILLHRDRRLFVVDNAADFMGDSVIDPGMIGFEQEADRFAADTLIPPDELRAFLYSHDKILTNEAIHDFADRIGISPGVVVGRLQHDGILQRWQGNNLKQKIAWGFVTEE